MVPLATDVDPRHAECADGWHAEPVTDSASDTEGYAERVKAKLHPALVRSTLAFAGLFQLTHEVLKSMVLDDVKSFFGYVSVGVNAVWLPEGGELEYRRKVLGSSPREWCSAAFSFLMGQAVRAGRSSAPISGWVVGTMLTRQRARTSSPR